MAKLNQKANPGGGGGFTESEEARLAYRKLKRWMRDNNITREGTFVLKGKIVKFLLNNGGYFTEKRTGNDGIEKDWPYVKVVTAVIDPQFGAPGLIELPPKKLGASFYDGRMSDGKRSPLRGGMYNVHLAATGQEPPQELVNGEGDWDTDDYVGKPLNLRIVYMGPVEETSKYYGNRGNMTLFMNGIEIDRDIHKPQADASLALDDDDDWVDDATDPQGAMAQAMGHRPAATTRASAASPSATTSGGATGDDGVPADFDSPGATDPKSPASSAPASSGKTAKASVPQSSGDDDDFDLDDVPF